MSKNLTKIIAVFILTRYNRLRRLNRLCNFSVRQYKHSQFPPGLEAPLYGYPPLSEANLKNYPSLSESHPNWYMQIV